MFNKPTLDERNKIAPNVLNVEILKNKQYSIFESWFNKVKLEIIVSLDLKFITFDKKFWKNEFLI